MKRITHCRACGSAALSPAFALEGASLETARKGILGRAKAEPVEFVLCDPSRDVHACGLLQSAHASEAPRRRSAPSGSFRTTRSSLRSLATESLELISGRDCAALDIGCSDGTLLSFYPRWVDRYGVDPSDDVDDVGEWAWTAKASFPSPDIDRAFNGKRFDLITASSALEEIEEPRAFLARVKSLLAADGVFAIETLYAALMLTRTAADAFASGVSAVYTISVLERVLRDCDLKIFRGALTEKDGGSLRLFVTHADASDYDFDPWYERLAQLWDEENALSLRSRAPYQAFERRAEEARSAFAAMLTGICARGERAHLFGTDAGAAMLYSWAGKGARAIEAAIGVGEIAEGARLMTGGPIIIPELESRATEPEYLIAPAALKREVLELWRDPILRGAKVLFALPSPHVVHAGNYAAEFGKSLTGGDGAGGADSLRAILRAAGGLRLVADSTGRRSA
ncbi:MAG: methyltransferase domain-containing protein [Parvularculaceae bacterium]|nr:methyltransferase domain-containing protein [Parvularculaceae bacterium]